eukprot:gene8902-9853_t
MAAVRNDDTLDILVIGGGWSGMLACKYALEHDLTVLVLEKRPSIGGVWCYSDDPQIPTVMKNTRTSSSTSVTEMSDFPMNEKIGEFPKHTDIYEYLLDYYAHFRLEKCFVFNCEVKQVRKLGKIWNIQTTKGDVYRSRNLAICTGVHQKPDLSAKYDLLKDFQGDIHHSSEFKEFCPSHVDKRVMIIGGGETASDVLEDWYSNCRSIIWCIPSGQHFFRKYAKILPHRKPQALDKASSRAMKAIAPYIKSKPGLAWVCKWTTNGSLLAYQGHGISEFRNNARFFHSFINKHGHVLDLIDYEKLIPKGAISSVEGKTVTFQDGDQFDVDAVILCTGYITEFPFLPDGVKDVALSDNYKFVFNTKDSSLAYLGFVRPIVGSIPGIAEMQAQWVTKVWAKKIPLANEGDRLIAVEKDNRFWSEHFKHTSHRIQTLVEGYTYLDDVAKLSNVFPDYWGLLKRNPAGFVTAIFAPYNGCSYRLNEPQHEAKALDTLRKHSQNSLGQLHLLLILFMRLIWFDWWLDQLAIVKYHIQRNRFWKMIRNTSVVKAANYIWTTPKRLLFDNKTR